MLNSKVQILMTQIQVDIILLKLAQELECETCLLLNLESNQNDEKTFLTIGQVL
jgi:hypothetical protein